MVSTNEAMAIVKEARGVERNLGASWYRPVKNTATGNNVMEHVLTVGMPEQTQDGLFLKTTLSQALASALLALHLSHLLSPTLRSLKTEALKQTRGRENGLWANSSAQAFVSTFTWNIPVANSRFFSGSNTRTNGTLPSTSPTLLRNQHD